MEFRCTVHGIIYAKFHPFPLVAGERTTNDLGTESIQVFGERRVDSVVRMWTKLKPVPASHRTFLRFNSILQFRDD